MQAAYRRRYYKQLNYGLHYIQVTVRVKSKIILALWCSSELHFIAIQVAILIQWAPNGNAKQHIAACYYEEFQLLSVVLNWAVLLDSPESCIPREQHADVSIFRYLNTGVTSYITMTKFAHLHTIYTREHKQYSQAVWKNTETVNEYVDTWREYAHHARWVWCGGYVRVICFGIRSFFDTLFFATPLDLSLSLFSTNNNWVKGTSPHVVPMQGKCSPSMMRLLRLA